MAMASAESGCGSLWEKEKGTYVLALALAVYRLGLREDEPHRGEDHLEGVASGVAREEEGAREVPSRITPPVQHNDGVCVSMLP